MTLFRSSLLVLALGGIASAQPATTTGPDGTAPPATPTPPPTAMAPAAPPPVAAPAESDSEIPPHHLVVGIGFGYFYAAGGNFDLETPNIASVRVRLGSGLTFEPVVRLTGSWMTQNTGVAGAMSTTDATGEIDVGTIVRYPVIRTHRFELQAVGDVDVDFLTDNPSGDNNTTTQTTFTIGWGIGLGYWIARHWEVTATATNPLFSVSHATTDTGANTTASTTNTMVGAIWSPSIAFMVHLYN